MTSPITVFEELGGCFSLVFSFSLGLFIYFHETDPKQLGYYKMLIRGQHIFSLIFNLLSYYLTSNHFHEENKKKQEETC